MGEMRVLLSLFAALPIHGQIVKLHVVHFNDVHARIEPVSHGGAPCSSETFENCYGGFAKLATVLKTETDAAETEGSAPLLLDAGDYFQGSVWDTFYQGEEIWQLYNLMNLDGMGVGNHDFDHGPEGFARFVGNSTTPVLTCNVNFDADANFEGLLDKIHTSLVVDKMAGATAIKVGLVGYTIKATETLSRPGPDIIFTDELEVVPQCLKDVAAAGAQAIVLIGHSGMDVDTQMAEIIAADDSIPKPVLFIGAHTHTPMGSMDGADPEDTYPKSLSGIPYVQAYFASVYAGAVEIEVDLAGVEAPVVVGSRVHKIAADPTSPDFVEDDPDVAAKILELAGPLEDFRNKKVGETTVPLPADEAIVLYEEALLGNMLTDAMAEYVNEMTGHAAEYGAIEMAMMNGGSIKYSMEGDIILEDVLSCMPYGNQLAFMRITGAGLRGALENGFSLWLEEGELSARFPQMSGIKAVFDGNKDSLERVERVEVKVEGVYVDLVDDDVYSLVANDYIAGGGEGYSDLAEADMISDAVVMDADAVVWYLEKHQVVTPVLEDRILNRALGQGGDAPTTKEGGAAGLSALLWLGLLPFLFN